MPMLESRIQERIRRLSTVSSQRYLDPDEAVPGAPGAGQLLPDELLSLYGLPELDSLTAEQRILLSREEVASITEAGLRFEAVLMAAFALELVTHPDLTDPRVVYSLHEVGEETRHSRLFSRLLTELATTSRNPLRHVRRLELPLILRLIRRPAPLDVLVLGGEEIPDLLQRKAADHPDTDPFIRAVNQYHRAEEARHLGFARAILPERWQASTRLDRWMVRHVVPRIIGGMFDMLIHPGVYEAVGLPGWRTWRRAKASPERIALRQEATRPILDALVAAEAFPEDRIPRPWRQLTGR